jgi:hypothetical protein
MDKWTETPFNKYDIHTLSYLHESKTGKAILMYRCGVQQVMKTCGSYVALFK